METMFETSRLTVHSADVTSSQKIRANHGMVGDVIPSSPLQRREEKTTELIVLARAAPIVVVMVVGGLQEQQSGKTGAARNGKEMVMAVKVG